MTENEQRTIKKEKGQGEICWKNNVQRKNLEWYNSAIRSLLFNSQSIHSMSGTPIIGSILTN